MTLGGPGVAGNDEGHFRSPAGVDRQMATSSSPTPTAPQRIVKYSKDGKFIKAGARPAMRRAVSGCACINMTRRGRLSVLDRQCAHPDLRQDGKFLAPGTSRDAERHRLLRSMTRQLICVRIPSPTTSDNPGFEQGIRSANAQNGWVKHFILDQVAIRRPRLARAGVRLGRQARATLFAGEPRPASAQIREGAVGTAASCLAVLGRSS